MFLNHADYSVNAVVLLGQRLTRSLGYGPTIRGPGDTSGGRPEALKSRDEADASSLRKGE
jgi:hypothetical protein